MVEENNTKEELLAELQAWRQRLAEKMPPEDRLPRDRQPSWEGSRECLAIAEALSQAPQRQNPRGRFVYANENAVFIFGYSVDEIMHVMGTDPTLDQRDIVVLPWSGRTGPIMMLQA